MPHKSPGPICSAVTLLPRPWSWQPPRLPSEVLLAVLSLSVPSSNPFSVLRPDRSQRRAPVQTLHERKALPDICPSIKATRTLKKTEVKINIFRTLETNQRFETTQRVFIQEKWLNLRKNNELYDMLTGPIPMPLPPALNQQQRDHSGYENRQTGSRRVGKSEFGAPQKLYP